MERVRLDSQFIQTPPLQAKISHCFVMPAFLNFSEDVDLWASLDTVLVTGETMQSKAFL